MFPTALVLSLAGLAGVVAAIPNKPIGRALGFLAVLGLAGWALTETTWPWPWAAVLLVGLGLFPSTRTARIRLAGLAASLLLISSLLVDRRVHETWACLDQALPQAQPPAHAPPVWGKPGGLTRLLAQPHERVGEAQATSGDRITTFEDGPKPGSKRAFFEASSARVVRLVLETGTATGVEVVATDNDFSKDKRALRLIQLPLESTDGTTVVEVDLTPILDGSWDQAGELRGLEVAWTGGLGTLHELVLEAPDALYRTQAVGEHRVELDGVIHPSWTLLDGASIALQVEGDTLSWFDGALGVGERVVTVDGVEVHRSADAGWSRVEVPMTQGRHQVVFSFTGAGIGLVGEPVAAIPAQDAPDVLIVLVDTLRADHIDDSTPSWQRIERQGVDFALTNSASSWTKPTIPTLMTGIWPTTHRVGSKTASDRLPESVPLVQERFRDAGWATASFSASPLGSTLSGLDRGFATALPPRAFGHMSRKKKQTPPDAVVFEHLLDWWDQQDRPVFAYVQLLDLHQYYERGPDRQWQDYRDAAVDADADFGVLLAQMEERGLLDDTLIVLTSDHGESFWDHSVPSHGTGLWQSQVQVPLVFWHPDLAPGVITQPTALADLAPTLVDLFGLPSLPDADGISLVPAMGGEALPERSIPSALIRYTWNPKGPQWVAMTTPQGPKVVQKGDDRFGVDLSQDLCEGSSGRPDRELVAELQAWRAGQTEAAEAFRAQHTHDQAGIGSAELELLRTLGYLE